MIHILAVDDEEDTLEEMKMLLTECLPEDEVTAFQLSAQALAWSKTHPVDIAFLDIEMPGIDGIELAKRIKKYHPRVNIIFTTGFRHYAPEAASVRMSGYLLKPLNKKQIEQELSLLRFPVQERQNGIYAVTFGSFMLMVDGREVHFGRSKSKEALAYLIDQHGREVDRKKMWMALFEEDSYDRKAQMHLNTILSDMKKVLNEAGVGRILKVGFNSYAVDTGQFTCDLYEYENGNPKAISAFHGIYMQEYSWGEWTLGKLYGDMQKQGIAGAKE